MREFRERCLTGTAWYTYVSVMCWLECPTLRSTQFLLPDAAFRGDHRKLGQRDLDSLRLEDLDPDARIDHVRLFGI